MNEKTLRGKTILVIESSTIDASRLSALLEGAGAVIIVSAQRADAVSMAARVQISAAVLDTRQHEPSGDALTRFLLDQCVPHFVVGDRLPVAKSPHVPALAAPRQVGEDVLTRLVNLFETGTRHATDVRAEAMSHQ
jgi:CheY-like chemotaxis protein